MNTLSGIIVLVETSSDLSRVEVDVGETVLTSVVLDTPVTAPHLRQGQAVSIHFKETEVAIAVGSVEGISLRNRLRGSVANVEAGVLLTQVTVDCGRWVVHSLITSKSSQALNLRPGMPVTALIKSTEISLEAVAP